MFILEIAAGVFLGFIILKFIKPIVGISLIFFLILIFGLGGLFLLNLLGKDLAFGLIICGSVIGLISIIGNYHNKRLIERENYH